MFYVSPTDSKRILEWNDLFRFSDIFNEKTLLPRDMDLSPRQIGLLTKYDYYNQGGREQFGWHRFSLIEAAAIKIIHCAKSYGLDRQDVAKLSLTLLGGPASDENWIYAVQQSQRIDGLKQGSGRSAILASILGIPMNLVWSHDDPCLSPIFCSEQQFQEDIRTKLDSYFKIRIDPIIDHLLLGLAEKKGCRYFSLIKLQAINCENYREMWDEEKRLLKLISDTLDPMVVTFGDSEPITFNPNGDRADARKAELAILARLAKRESKQINIKIFRNKDHELHPQRE